MKMERLYGEPQGGAGYLSQGSSHQRQTNAVEGGSSHEKLEILQLPQWQTCQHSSCTTIAGRRLIQYAACSAGQSWSG